MTYRDFCYWLKGYDELVGEIPTLEQWKEIQEHLNICFNCELKVDYNPVIINYPNYKPSDMIKYMPMGSC